MHGAADNNGDRRVDIEEAFAYLEEEVQELAQKRNHQQTPQKQVWGDTVKPYYLKLEAKAKPLQIIIATPEKLQNNDICLSKNVV